MAETLCECCLTYLLVASVFYYASCFFFFKQKTAYEMRISDWSSDVCSSDLGRRRPAGPARRRARRAPPRGVRQTPRAARTVRARLGRGAQIGRASCRERVCQYV